MKLQSGVYLIRNIISGKVYIGSAVNIEKRCYGHKWALERQRHCNIHLQRAWNKDGKDLFVFETFLICKKENLVFYEQSTIDAFVTYSGQKNAYNISPTAGSTLGRKHTEATKIRIGLTSKGRWNGRKHTELTKEKISLGNIGKNKGKIASDEARRKMSKSRKGKRFPLEHRRKISLANKGHQVSPETREKLRIANTGRVVSEETKKKIGFAFRGKPGTRLGIKNKPPLIPVSG